MRGKKTITVDQIREWANTALQVADSSYHLREEMTPHQIHRQALYGFLEQILHGTGNYNGFGYKDPKTPDGFVRGTTDETRRCYY